MTYSQQKTLQIAKQVQLIRLRNNNTKAWNLSEIIKEIMAWTLKDIKRETKEKKL